MKGDVLVLNRCFMAIHSCDWQKTMALMFRGHALAVDQNYQTYDFEQWKEKSLTMTDFSNGSVTTVSFKIAIPDVIKLRYYDELPRTEVRYSRKNLYKHYRNICCYCGKRFKSEELNLDHVIPRSQGGLTSWDNIVVTCISCNSKKDRHTPEQAGLRMFYQPSKPLWKPSWATKVTSTLPIRKEWANFIDTVYLESVLRKD